MRLRYLTVLSTLALCLSTATAARADGLIVPFLGVTFGGDTVENRTVYGAALGFTGISEAAARVAKFLFAAFLIIAIVVVLIALAIGQAAF